MTCRIIKNKILAIGVFLLRFWGLWSYVHKQNHLPHPVAEVWAVCTTGCLGANLITHIDSRAFGLPSFISLRCTKQK